MVLILLHLPVNRYAEWTVFISVFEGEWWALKRRFTHESLTMMYGDEQDIAGYPRRPSDVLSGQQYDMINTVLQAQMADPIDNVVFCTGLRDLIHV